MGHPDRVDRRCEESSTIPCCVLRGRRVSLRQTEPAPLNGTPRFSKWKCSSSTNGLPQKLYINLPVHHRSRAPTATKKQSGRCMVMPFIPIIITRWSLFCALLNAYWSPSFFNWMQTALHIWFIKEIYFLFWQKLQTFLHNLLKYRLKVTCWFVTDFEDFFICCLPPALSSPLNTWLVHESLFFQSWDSF